MDIELQICDKALSKKGIFEIRGLKPLKGYNGFTGELETLIESDIRIIDLITYEKLLYMGKELALEKIFNEFPDIFI